MSEEYEGIADTRSHIERQLDADWKPQPAQQAGQHRYDNAIATLNREAAEQTTPHEPNTSKRLAGYLTDIRERDFDNEDNAAGLSEHLEKVQPQLEKIAALKQRMLEDKEQYVRSDFINLDKAAKSLSENLRCAEGDVGASEM